MKRQTKLVFLLSVGTLLVITACQQNPSDNKSKLSTDKKAILTLYATQYLSQDNQQLYAISEKKKRLLTILDPPITAEDFKLPKISTLFGDSQQYLDTLFSEHELQSWSTQIENYQQIRWNQSMFPDSINFIRVEQVPENAERYTGNLPEHDLVFIHYISIPFIYNGKSALLYSRKWSGGAYVDVRFHYYKKESDSWEQIKEGRLNIGY